jgi:hypothetical protein
VLKTWEILDAVMESDLPQSVRWIIAVIGSCQNHTQGRPAFPDFETIARKAGCSERAAKENVKLAVEAGWLEVSKARGEGKKYVHNVYKIQVPTIKPSAESAPGFLTDGKPSAENSINRVQNLHTNNEGNNEVKIQVKESPYGPESFAVQSIDGKKDMPSVPANFVTWAVKRGATRDDCEPIWETHYCEHAGLLDDPFCEPSMRKLYATASQILGIAA